MKISCILLASPGRERLRDMAIRCYERQTYQDRELIIIDGTQGVIGDLRNAACERATGDLIAHWDDDDWSHPERLERCAALLVERNLAVTGLCRMPFWDCDTQAAYLYDSQPDTFQVGTSLLYRRDWWEQHRFPSTSAAEDVAFVYATPREKRLSLSDYLMVATCHGANTQNKSAKLKYWQPLDRAELPGEWTRDAAEFGLLR